MVNDQWGLSRNATNPTERLLQVRGWDVVENRPIVSFRGTHQEPGRQFRIEVAGTGGAAVYLPI